jgi:hypothetical protein
MAQSKGVYRTRIQFSMDRAAGGACCCTYRALKDTAAAGGPHHSHWGSSWDAWVPMCASDTFTSIQSVVQVSQVMCQQQQAVCLQLTYMHKTVWEGGAGGWTHRELQLRPCLSECTWMCSNHWYLLQLRVQGSSAMLHAAVAAAALVPPLLPVLAPGCLLVVWLT